MFATTLPATPACYFTRHSFHFEQLGQVLTPARRPLLSCLSSSDVTHGLHAANIRGPGDDSVALDALQLSCLWKSTILSSHHQTIGSLSGISPSFRGLLSKHDYLLLPCPLYSVATVKLLQHSYPSHTRWLDLPSCNNVQKLTSPTRNPWLSIHPTVPAAVVAAAAIATWTSVSAQQMCVHDDSAG